MAQQAFDSASNTFTVRLEVASTSQKLFVDGVLRVSANDAQVSGAGTVGLFGGMGASFDNFVSAPIQLTNPGPSYSDSFGTSADGRLNGNWLDREGEFRVTGGAAVGNAMRSIATVNGGGQADASAQASVTLAVGQGGGVVARYTAAGDFYLAFVSRTSSGYVASIYRRVGGAYTQVAQQAFDSASNTFTVRLEVASTSQKLFVDGVLRVSANDAQVSGAGTVGLFGGMGASFDNFVSAPIQLTNPGPSYSDSFGTSADGRLNGNWLDREGEFRVTGGAAVGNAMRSIATVNGGGQADASAQASVTLAVGQGGGVVARYTAAGDFYLAFVSRTSSGYVASIYRRVGGAYTQVAQQAFDSTATSLSVRLEVAGSSQKLFVDGVLRVSANDTQVSGAGTVGLFGGMGASFDNFITVPGNGLATIILPELDLNLLGLTVHTSTIAITVSANAGDGKLLGNLLTTASNLINLQEASNALNQVLDSTVNLLNSADLIVGGVGSGSLDSRPAATTQVLQLFVAPVHLDLLGAVVDTSPIRVDISAQSGEGLILGNVVTDLANLFNPPLPDQLDIDFINGRLNDLLSALNHQIPESLPHRCRRCRSVTVRFSTSRCRRSTLTCWV